MTHEAQLSIDAIFSDTTGHGTQADALRCFLSLQNALLVVDEHRKVVLKTDRAKELLGQSQVLEVSQDKLGISSNTYQRARFDNWWKVLMASNSSEGDCFQVSELSGVWEIEASWVSAAAGTDGADRRWMLTLKERPDATQISISYLMAMHRLTRAEANTCACLCRNGDAVSTGRAMGVSPNTVRSHLKSAFKKTGTRNQVELVVRLISQL
jgi:DNA-binding CsgD family transcriptional regulator